MRGEAACRRRRRHGGGAESADAAIRAHHAAHRGPYHDGPHQPPLTTEEKAKLVKYFDNVMPLMSRVANGGAPLSADETEFVQLTFSLVDRILQEAPRGGLRA